MRVTICNSPPQSGKDAFTTYLAKKHQDVSHLEFKKKLIELTKLIYDIDDTTWVEIYTNELKDVPMNIFDGKSPRQALIYVSEDVIKPKFGRDYFGKAAARLLSDSKLNIFSDGGFYDEMIQVSEKCGYENTFILDFKMKGRTFKDDSRGYVDLPNVERFSFDNNGSIDELFAQIKNLVTNHPGATVDVAYEVAVGNWHKLS
jgi:hypothetical protein